MIKSLDEMMRKERTETSQQLDDILSSKLRPSQYKIIEKKNGFTVKVSFIPPNFVIPGKIGYFNVDVKKVKAAELNR